MSAMRRGILEAWLLSVATTTLAAGVVSALSDYSRQNGGATKTVGGPLAAIAWEPFEEGGADFIPTTKGKEASIRVNVKKNAKHNMTSVRLVVTNKQTIVRGGERVGNTDSWDVPVNVPPGGNVTITLRNPNGRPRGRIAGGDFTLPDGKVRWGQVCSDPISALVVEGGMTGTFYLGYFIPPGQYGYFYQMWNLEDFEDQSKVAHISLGKNSRAHSFAVLPNTFQHLPDPVFSLQDLEVWSAVPPNTSYDFQHYMLEADALGVPGAPTAWHYDPATGMASMTFFPDNPLEGLGGGMTGSIVAYSSPFPPNVSSPEPNVAVDYIGEFQCPLDAVFAPSPPVGLHAADFNFDGFVDVLDLLGQLNNWGDCKVCGNCPTDLNGDCVTDVLDLLNLLDGWGDSHLLGRCCLSDGICDPAATFVQCSEDSRFLDWDDALGASCQDCAAMFSCKGRCGRDAPVGCWCDADCAIYGDCCADACELCDACECEPPDCILPADDCFTTLCNGNTHVDFDQTPLPPNFFDPGSDPFFGTVFLGGPNAPFQPDTVVHRHGVLRLDPPYPATDTVPIEIVMLNLISCQPITVTYNGGQNPEPWDVTVDLSQFAFSQGSMTVTKDSPEGGTFDSALDVVPRFTFTRQKDGETRVLDTGDPDLGIPPIPLFAIDAPWRHEPLGLTCDPNFTPGAAPGSDCCEEICHAAPPPIPHQHCVQIPMCPHCPPQFGACCLGPGQCIDGVTPVQCSGMGGNYVGDGTVCQSGGMFFHNAFANLPIPDNDPVGVSHTIFVPEDGVINDVDVRLTIMHTWVGDLCVSLTAPDGVTTVHMIQRPGTLGDCHQGGPFGCPADNYNSIFLDDQGTGGPIENQCINNLTSPPNYTPNQPLGLFNGMNATGLWTLTVSDNAAQDIGTLISWGIRITTAGTCD